MDRHELCDALRAAGVPAAYYEIPGCPGGPRPSDHYFLEERDGRWLVGVHERDTRDVHESFPDEAQACRWLYDRLTYQGPPPSRPTLAEAEELLHDSEGIARRAREELDQALAAAARRKAAGEPPTDGDSGMSG
jgi:acetyl esterase/lipase